jgi:hypothetical protein
MMRYILCSPLAYENPIDIRLQLKIQQRYEKHRTARNADQKKKLLHENFTAFNLDDILQRLHFPDVEPGFKDHRNCLVFWGRPTQPVKNLIAQIQKRLVAVAPSMYPIISNPMASNLPPTSNVADAPRQPSYHGAGNHAL